ncbi:MAG: hypothetical protein J5988_06115, partial [Eubacterium sp.]|nr:hypothetical protein [Eubacterium sp.]
MRKKTTAKAMAMCLTLAMVVGVLPQTGMPKAIAAETTDETQTNGDSQVASGGGITVTPTPTPGTDSEQYKPATPTIELRGGSKRVRVTWKKIEGADGYCIYSRPSTDSAYTKTDTISDGTVTTYDKKSLLQNTTYYFRMTAYKNVNGTIVESDLSAAVSAKTAAVSATSKTAKKYSTKTSFTKSPAYKTYKKMRTYMSYTRSFAIPGMKTTNVAGFQCTSMIPQAICHAGSYLLISAYDSKGVDYSVIYVVSKAAKSYVTTIVLPSKAKVGGMAYDGTNIWISKGTSVASFPYSVVTDAVNSGASYMTLANYSTVNKVNGTASYMGYYNNVLWVGSFSQSSSTMYGYSIADKTKAPSLQQTYTMTVPSKTQGITFDSDGKMILTRSYRTKKAKSGYISQIRTYYPSYSNAGTNGNILKNTALAVTTMPPMVE